MLEFEDELFAEYRNTSNYHTMRKPQKPRKSSPHEEIFDPSEEAFLKKTTKELVSIISNEWLEESELSSDVIHLLYRFVAKLIKLLSMLFTIQLWVLTAHDLLKHMPLTPTTKLLKSLSGHILPSLGILYVLLI